jgi:hypothetical protein
VAPPPPDSHGLPERIAAKERAIEDDRGIGNRHVHTRDAGGNLLIDGIPAKEFEKRGRGATEAPKPADAPSDDRLKPLSDVGKPGAMVRLSDDLEVPEAEYREVAAELAARKAGTASAPATAADYKVEVSEDFVLPVGAQPFKFDQNSPLVAGAKEIAKKYGLTQDALTAFSELYARERVEADSRMRAARATEVQKLGPMVSERMSAINRFIEGKLGAADARPLLDSVWTAAAAQSWEKLITKLASSGSSYGHHGREPPGRGGPSEETWNSWSIGQRMNFARNGRPDDYG